MPKFTKMEYKNIQSVGNTPLTIDLCKSLTTLIGGKNGSGKSTMLLAFAYGLFGSVLSGEKLGNIINSINKKNLLVSIWFEKNGETWKVVRGEKPKKFEIYRNDELMDQYANARDQQKFLEVILGMDFKLFTQVILLNKERYVPFMESTAADRRKVIEDILNISVFSYMNDICKTKQREIDGFKSTAERDRDIIKTQIESQKDLVSHILQQIEKEKSSNDNEIKLINDQMSVLDSSIKSYQDKREQFIFDSLDSVQKQKNEIQKISIQFESKVNENKKNIKFFTENDDCPTCGQDIDDSVREPKVKKFQSVIDEVTQSASEMMVVLTEIVGQEKSLLAAKEEYTQCSLEISRLEFQKKTLSNQLQSIVNRSKSADTADKLNESTAKLHDMENKLQVNTDNLQRLFELAEKYNTIRDMLKDDGIKAVIVKDYLNIINVKINEFLTAMNFYINMKLDENFNETFHAMNKENFSYKSLSTGQKTRVNLAIWLALLEVAAVKNSVVCNVLFLDEILENLDSEGVKDFMDLAREKLSTSNIFIISQRFDEFKDYFRSSIQFKLNQNFTEIA